MVTMNVESVLQICDKYGTNCNEYSRLPAGTTTRKTIREWLIVVGLGEAGLNAENTDGAFGRVKLDPGMVLAYRTTGVKISLKFDYRGKAGPDSYGDPTKPDGIVCYITATMTGGWHSFGSDVAYSDHEKYPLGVDFPKYNSQTGEVDIVNYHDRYNRGVFF